MGQSLLEEIYEQMPVDRGLWYQIIENGRRREVFRSAAFAQIYGYPSPDQMPQNALRKLVVAKDQRRVAVAILNAMRNPGGAHQATFRILVNGAVRWINAYYKRMKVGDIDLIAGLHTDVTQTQRAQEWRKFSEAALDQLPGYVFVKDYVENEAGGRFVFRYINKALAQAFGLQEPQDAYGHSDEKFITKKSEVQSFFEADKAAFNGRRVHVKNENLTLADGSQLILATIKTPIKTDMFSLTGSDESCVLGVAVDITRFARFFSDALKEIDEAVYIKNREGQYVYANPSFARLIGKKDADLDRLVLNKTFREATGGVNNNLVSLIEQEDQLVLETGQTVEAVRSAKFSDGRTWAIRKSLMVVPSMSGPPEKFVLGIARDVHDSAIIDREILDASPFSFCLKNRKYEIVRWNQAYLKTHPRFNKDNLRGKTDFELWPETIGSFKNQAKGFRERDEAIFRLAEEYASGKISKEELEARLDHDHRQFPEYLINDKNEKRTLLTSKRPALVNGEWHIVVTCDDVTDFEKRTEVELRKYHSYTLHSIRSEMAPLSRLRDLIERAILTNEFGIGLAEEAQRRLATGAEGVEFYLHHALKFLELRHDNLKLKRVSLSQLLEKETRRFALSWNSDLDVNLELPELVNDLPTKLDQEVFVAVFREILYNASKNIWLRNTTAEEGGWTQARGVISVRLIKEEPLYPFAQPNAVVLIDDNGLATVCQKARFIFEEKFLEAKGANKLVSAERLGLEFCLKAIEMLSGRLDIDFSKLGAPQIRMSLPLLEH